MATLHTQPIWSNTYYSTASASTPYRIELEGNTIFSGKAVKYPNAERLRINIDKICRNYLESGIDYMFENLNPGTGQLFRVDHEDSQRRFKLYLGDTNVADYRFYQDWSYTYDKAVTGSTINVSNPINNHYVPGMIKLKTIRNSNSNATTGSTVYTLGSTDTSESYGYDKQVKCSPYALYYLNSYGGWDSFLIEGTAKKKDAYTTYQTDRVYDNNTAEFETMKYMNEYKTSYELNTHYLSDEEAANLAKNLVGSIKVYLHNIPEGWVKPVIIDDKNVTYQTYQTNGRKMCQYKINVTESQSKLRK